MTKSPWAQPEEVAVLEAEIKKIDAQDKEETEAFKKACIDGFLRARNSKEFMNHALAMNALKRVKEARARGDEVINFFLDQNGMAASDPNGPFVPLEQLLKKIIMESLNE